MTPKRGWGLLQVDGVATVVAINGCQVRLMIKEGPPCFLCWLFGWVCFANFFWKPWQMCWGLWQLRWDTVDMFRNWLLDLHQVCGVVSSMSWRQGDRSGLKQLQGASRRGICSEFFVFCLWNTPECHGESMCSAASQAVDETIDPIQDAISRLKIGKASEETLAQNLDPNIRKLVWPRYKRICIHWKIQWIPMVLVCLEPFEVVTVWPL